MAYGARLESGLGVTPQGFESPILRQMKAAKRMAAFVFVYTSLNKVEP